MSEFEISRSLCRFEFKILRNQTSGKRREGKETIAVSKESAEDFYYFYFFDKTKQTRARIAGFSSRSFSSDLCDCVGFRHHHVRVAVFHQIWNLFLPPFLPRSVGRSAASTDIVSHLPLISQNVIVLFFNSCFLVFSLILF
jgi:hypothetical protein